MPGTIIPGSIDSLIDDLCADFARLAPENKFTRTDPAKVIPSFLRHSIRKPLLRPAELPDVSSGGFLPAVVGAEGEDIVGVDGLPADQTEEEREDSQAPASESFSDDTLIMSPALKMSKPDMSGECKDVEDRITSSELLIPESNPNHTIGSPCEPSRSAVSTTADIYAWRSRQSAFSLDNDADSTLHEDELADDSDRDGRSPSTLSIGGSPGPIQQFSTVDIAPARTSHPSSPTSDQPIQHVESARELAVATVGETTETTLGHLRQASSATELDRHDPPLHEDSVDSIDSPLDDADWFRTSSPRSPRPLSVLPGLPLVSLDELLLDSDDSANCLGLSFRSDVSPVPSRTRARPQSPEWLVDDSVSLELETACSTARRLLVTEDYSAPSTLSRSSSITGSVSGLDEEDEEDYAVEGEDDDGWAQVHKGLGCVALAGLVAFLYLAVLAY